VGNSCEEDCYSEGVSNEGMGTGIKIGDFENWRRGIKAKWDRGF